MARSPLPYLRQARFVREPGLWTLLHLPDAARPTVDDALVWLAAPRDHTLVVPAASADAHEARLQPLGRSDGWVMLTIEVEVPLDVGGFFVHFAKGLADAGIPMVPVAGYRCDHVLVRDVDAERALAAFHAVQDAAASGTSLAHPS